ncbi:MAG: hypothetical protein HGA78_09430, partial [Nitrospirales bacterium]|nr:hypothetical protein [Nitrospirales bacterium]
MIFFTEEEIDRFISEDIAYGDLTTHSLGIGQKRGANELELSVGEPADHIPLWRDDLAQAMNLTFKIEDDSLHIAREQLGCQFAPAIGQQSFDQEL